MKIGKSQLKALIKECLVEILAEGLGNNLNEAVSQPRGPRNRDVEPIPGQRVAPRMNVDPLAGRRAALDATTYAPQQPQRGMAPPPPPVPSHLASNPMMAAIFADTAATTLVEQNNNVRPGGDRAAQIAAQVEPTQVFSEEQIDRWNEAAFKPSRPGGGLLGGGLPPDFLHDLLKGT